MSTRFDYFWTLVPKKVAKKMARERYAVAVCKLVHRDPNLDPHEFLADAMRRYARSQKVAEGIILHPSTWLHQERFDDEDVDVAKDDPQHVKVRASRMDATTREEMRRAAAIRRQRDLNPLMPTRCEHCGSDLYWGRETKRWQCTSRECWRADNSDRLSVITWTPWQMLEMDRHECDRGSQRLAQAQRSA